MRPQCRTATTVIAVSILICGVAGCSPGETGDEPPLAPPTSVEAWIGEELGDAPVYPYEHLAADDRDGWVELVPDLIIGERPDDPLYAFAEEVPTLAVDDDGRIFVFDPSNYRIAVFDAAGEFLYQFGGRGEGPGEFVNDGRGLMGFRNGLLFMFEWRRIRFWTPEGTFVEGTPHDIGEHQEVQAVDDGTLMTTDRGRVGDSGRGPYWMLARYAIEDGHLEEHLRYAVAPIWSRADFAATPSGNAYMSIVGEDGRSSYLVAYDSDADIRWVARGTWPRRELLAAEVVIDGHGRVFVLPRVNQLTEESSQRTVDVFTAEGQIIGRARIENFQTYVRWQEARGDFIYGVQADPDTFEWRVVRYRLELPWE